MERSICERCALYFGALKHAAVFSMLAEVDSIQLGCSATEEKTATLTSRVTFKPNIVGLDQQSVEIIGAMPTNCPNLPRAQKTIIIPVEK